MDMVYFVAALIIIFTLLGGVFAIRFRDKLHLILGFSAGAVFAVALFDLLPEAIELTSGSYSTEIVTLLTAAGFALYLILDRFFSIHKHDDKCCKDEHHGTFGAIAIILHSFFDGFGIGIAFKISPVIGWTVALAILAHRFSDGINTVGIVLRDDGKKRALKYLVTVALIPALGIISTVFINVSEAVLGLIMAVFAGLFLYLGASDLIPESHHRHPTIWTTVMTVLGIGVLFLVIRVAG